MIFFMGCAGIAPNVQTSHMEAKRLSVPSEQKGFCFAIFSDRTGGDETEGAKVWQQAICQANQMGPDFVYTVGDLIQGCHDRPVWLQEYKAFDQMMQSLKMPWYPVAGNHDVYWNHEIEERAQEHHETDYETDFGPLWYAFEYENCWFISLFSDEGNPDKSEKGYQDPALQKMSPECSVEKLFDK